MILMDYSGAQGTLIHEKKAEIKNLPLTVLSIEILYEYLTKSGASHSIGLQ